MTKRVHIIVSEDNTPHVFTSDEELFKFVDKDLGINDMGRNEEEDRAFKKLSRKAKLSTLKDFLLYDSNYNTYAFDIEVNK